MRYSDYIASPRNGQMIYKADVSEIVSALMERYDDRFLSLREKLQELHGYDYWREAQNLAFLALFSNMPEYNSLLEGL